VCGPLSGNGLGSGSGSGSGSEGKMHKESGESREGGLSLPSPFSLLSLFIHLVGAGAGAGAVAGAMPGIWGGFE